MTKNINPGEKIVLYNLNSNIRIKNKFVLKKSGGSLNSG
jgi:hypothetical protein